MPKSQQSVCKRTRSKSKQTSLLDFDAPSSRTAATTTTATAAATSNAGGPDADDDDAAGNKPGGDVVRPRAAKPTSKRGRPRAVKSKAKRKAPPVVAGATAGGGSVPDAPASGPAKGKKRRATVCSDVTTAKRPRGKAGGPQDDEEEEDEGEVKAEKKDQKQSSVTPSPYLEARKEAARAKFDIYAEAFAASSRSKSGKGAGSSLADGDSDDDEQSDLVSTPSPQKKKKKKKNTGNKAAASGVRPRVGPRSVTLDPNEESLRLSLHRDERELVAPPAFHHPWKPPYRPANVSEASSPSKKDDGASTAALLPPGVVDIDLLAHRCCARSTRSHAGYSWLTSTRRCGCPVDADHCSAESLAEAYLGGYGADRYGDVGAAGVVGTGGGTGRLVNEGDWRAERRWLEQVGREREMRAATDAAARKGGRSSNKLTPKGKKGKGGTGTARTSSPTSTLSDSDASSLSSNDDVHLKATAAPPAVFPSSVEEHLDYMPRQPHITTEMRSILVDWLSEVAEEYRLTAETFWLSVALVDRSLACSYVATKGKGINTGEDDDAVPGGEMIVKKDMLQLVGCACTLLASKIVEITPPTAEDFVYISDKTYTRREVLDMEARVCAALKFDLSLRTPYHYVDRFLRASRASSESSAPTPAVSALNRADDAASNVLPRRLVHYLLDLATLEYRLVSKKPALVAAAAVYLARATLGLREEPPSPPPASATGRGSRPSSSFRLGALSGHWSRTLEHYTGYDVWDLEETVKLLHRLQECAEERTPASVYNKHKANKRGRVALRTVLREEDLGFL